MNRVYIVNEDRPKVIALLASGLFSEANKPQLVGNWLIYKDTHTSTLVRALIAAVRYEDVVPPCEALETELEAVWQSRQTTAA